MMSIAIVTSFYNGYEQFLPQWIESINNLTVKPTRIITVASGPFKYDGKNPITYFIPEHRGMGYARNMAVELADSEWIMYLDIDDIILPRTLEYAEKYINADVICGGLKITGDRGDRIKMYPHASLENALQGINVCCSHAIYRKSLWEQSPYLEINDYIEQPLWAGFARLGAKFVGTEEVFTQYNTRKDGHNMQLTKEQMAEAKEQKFKKLRGEI